MDSRVRELHLVATLSHERASLLQENLRLRAVVEDQERLLGAATEMIRDTYKTTSSV